MLDDPGGSTSNGTVIDQWQLNGGANQRWDLVPVGNGNYFIQNEASQLVLDNCLSTINGTVIDQWLVVRRPEPAMADPPSSRTATSCDSQRV